MTAIFDIHVFPAQRGDALWVEYGEDRSSAHHILIDGGITATGRTHLRKRIEERGEPLHFELFVITHIDLDHILGALELLKALPDGVTFGDIWFNGWDQLNPTGIEPFGVKEGIHLSELLEQHHSENWNKAAAGRAISLDTAGKAVSYAFPGGMEVTVLSPGTEQLEKLRTAWGDVLEALREAAEAEAAGKVPLGLDIAGAKLEPMGADGIDVPRLASTPSSEDDTIPNGSSIAISLKFRGKKALMLADAHPSVISAALRPLAEGKRVQADLVKLSHHGSRYNTDKKLTSLLHAPKWVFSSNGANNTKHPHREAVARVLHYGEGVETLYFNYRTEFNEAWDDDELMEQHGYQVVYGDGKAPIVISLL